ncbi:MAG: ATPase, T2SS/T4P/T4SS family, partial [Planctomycetota bacterium]|nr:ATPase, T2SS/T4P/T4SS family [Planctomycetota bacterium]
MIATGAANSLMRFDLRSFGQALVKAGELSEVDWRLAEEVGRQNGQTILRAVLDLGLMSEDALADQLSAHVGRPRWKCEEDDASEVSDAAPREFMASNGVLLLEAERAEGDGERADGAIRLICTDPSDHHLLRSLLSQVGRPVEVEFGTQKDITRFFALRSEIEGPGAGEDDDGSALDVSTEISQLRDMASEAPVVRFFNQAIERAMELGASDVHLERFDHRVSLRMRVDGMLVDQPAPQPRMYEPLLCRIKIMAGLDIAERRKPQDGRIRMRLRGRMVDLRVSLVPTMYGQDAAMRLQDRQMLGDIDLTGLGFSKGQVKDLFATAAKSHGILLVTGPTGSGKTTTLYALLRRLVNVERKVVTVEDPVEYAMDGVNQIQVNPSIGLTFGNTLRHILRHDPDVILIGEIRDRDTM